MEEVLNFLEDQDADIVLLQEVYDGTDQRLPVRYRSLETLLNRLLYSHHSFAADYLEKHPSGAVARRGNAILSRFPIRKKDALFFSNSYSETYVDTPDNVQDCPRNIPDALVDMPVSYLLLVYETRVD